jgi:hypothetical protein
LIWCDGLQNNVTIITLKLNLFPFLFPRGHGVNDCKIPSYEYLKVCMGSLFSPFTLYKPYLLIMYDIQQLISFIKQTSNICLEKKWKNKKIIKNDPQMNDSQILQHIIKHKLAPWIKDFPCDIDHNYKVC